MTTYLTVDYVIALNETITNTQGLLRDRNGLEGALMRPQQAAYYEAADLIAQTALLTHGIAQTHPFQDGNKRTALLAGAAFLEENGYEVRAHSDDFGKQVLELVLSNNVKRFEAWLRQHVSLT